MLTRVRPDCGCAKYAKVTIKRQWSQLSNAFPTKMFRLRRAGGLAQFVSVVTLVENCHVMVTQWETNHHDNKLSTQPKRFNQSMQILESVKTKFETFQYLSLLNKYPPLDVTGLKDAWLMCTLTLSRAVPLDLQKTSWNHCTGQVPWCRARTPS